MAIDLLQINICMAIDERICFPWFSCVFMHIQWSFWRRKLCLCFMNCTVYIMWKVQASLPRCQLRYRARRICIYVCIRVCVLKCVRAQVCACWACVCVCGRRTDWQRMEGWVDLNVWRRHCHLIKMYKWKVLLLIVVYVKQLLYPVPVIKVKRIIQTEPTSKIKAIRTVSRVKYVWSLQA